MFDNFSKSIDTWHDFFVTYQDRILFGTDSVVEKITWSNYIDFVGEKIAPIDTNGLYSAAEHVLSELYRVPEDSFRDHAVKVCPSLINDMAFSTAADFFERILAER